MNMVVFDKENGELRVVTDFFAALQSTTLFKFAPGVSVGDAIAPGDDLVVVQTRRKADRTIKAPRNCRGTINGLGNWGADMGEAPSKVLLYIHPTG